MPPVVSAIITTYNYARYLPEAIESVLQQTIRPDEIVVIDDGSTDDTAEVVAPYAAAGVRYVYQANGGAGAARNRGLRETHGELVAFLDGDDRWLPDKLARQLDHFQRYPQVGLVTGGEWQVFETGQAPLRVDRPPVGAARFYPRILIENIIGNPSSTLIRRACFDQVGGFDESLRLGQDWEMWIRIAQAFPIGVVADPVITFTQHAGSLTAGRGAARYASNQLIRRRYISQVQPPWLRFNLWRAAQAMSSYYRAAAIADEPDERGTARRMAVAAFLLDPFHDPTLKLGVLFRAFFGRAAFDRLRQRLHPTSIVPTPTDPVAQDTGSPANTLMQ